MIEEKAKKEQQLMNNCNPQSSWIEERISHLKPHYISGSGVFLFPHWAAALAGIISGIGCTCFHHSPPAPPPHLYLNLD